MSAKSSDAETMTNWDAELARVALGPVLIDTSNLENDAKTTYTDVEAMKYLKRFIVAEEGDEFKASDYYEEIWTAERDVDGLSLTDLLRKDYKQWTEHSVNLGVCSVVKNVEFLLEKVDSQDKFFNTLKAFSKERGLSICCVMTRASTDDGGFKRELLIWGLDEKGVEAVKKFEAQSAELLGLETWKNGSLDFHEEEQLRKCWVQNQIEHSRKQVAPLLRSSMAR
ncbi:putative exopolyphosphatase [Diplocarpon rosae]|nr:putative exopolyphosphatase [Diplocarpon rosae]